MSVRPRAVLSVGWRLGGGRRRLPRTTMGAPDQWKPIANVPGRLVLFSTRMFNSFERRAANSSMVMHGIAGELLLSLVEEELADGHGGSFVALETKSCSK